LLLTVPFAGLAFCAFLLAGSEAPLGEALVHAPFVASLCLAWLTTPIAMAVAPRALLDDAFEGYLALTALRGISLRKWIFARVSALAILLFAVIAAVTVVTALVTVPFAPAGRHFAAFFSLVAGLAHAAAFGAFLGPLAFATSAVLPKDVRAGVPKKVRTFGAMLLLPLLLDFMALGAALPAPGAGRLGSVPAVLRAATQVLGPQGGRPLEAVFGVLLIAVAVALAIAVLVLRLPKTHAAELLATAAGREPRRPMEEPS
jgi:hypothetical protein